jgi:PCFT/HCP family folate transporter-like MFS transporter 1/3
LLLSFGSLLLGGTWTIIVLVRPDVFPVRLILLSPFFNIFGGGLVVITAAIHSIIADVATEKCASPRLSWSPILGYQIN